MTSGYFKSPWRVLVYVVLAISTVLWLVPILTALITSVRTFDDILMNGSYKWERGGRQKVVAACIDSGGHHTQAVYEYVRPRQAHRIFAIKGMAGFGRPILSSPSRKRTGRNRRPVDLFTVGVDSAKGLIYSRLRITDRGPGYIHFPLRREFDEEFFAQLTAEKCVTRYQKGFPKREWIKIRGRNEALDCTVYALAALYNLNPMWDALVARAEHGQTQPVKKPARKTRPRHRGGWVNKYRGEWQVQRRRPFGPGPPSSGFTPLAHPALG